ncbi:MAG: NAD(P)/FAD-dependent oxidoreductase [Thermoplasmatota archaeon]
MKYDIVIIGAGPAGLFAANEIVENSSHKVVVIDKGKDIKNRQCPSALQFVRCKRCSPCNILCGLGGAGGLSDGKLNLKSNIGGNLEDFVSTDIANELIDKVGKMFNAHGAPDKTYGEDTGDLEVNAASHGIQFIPIPQRHIGSDRLPAIISSMKESLQQSGVDFLLNTSVEQINRQNNHFILSIKDKEPIETKYILAAPGRSGGDWLSSEANRLGIQTRFAPIDIGVRVEVPAVVMENVIRQSWDPKFHIMTKTFDDFIRTFCTCPNGFVVMEDYGDYIGVNGHSMASRKSENTNFAFVTKVKLTEPLENTTAYGISIAKLATTIGGKMPLVQRLEDLKKGRRSTRKRIEKSFITPTLHNATPGDISMALPYRIVKNIIEGLDILNEVIPGVASDSTLLYAPEIKFSSMRFIVNNNLESSMENFFVAGDGAGLSRGIVSSAATGIIAARGILEKNLIM